MAIHEVSTWAGLVSAIGSAANNDTIKLIKDINCNDEIPEGVTSSVAFNAVVLTIDGSYEEGGVTKNYEIRNLRTNAGSPVVIFKENYSNSNVTFKNIDFVNLILDSALISVSNAANLYFRNCRFTGKRTTNIIRKDVAESAGYIYLYNCFFNVPYYGTTLGGVSICRDYASNFKCRAYYCRFVETFIGNYSPSSSTYYLTCGVSYTWLNGCRVEGTIVCAARYASSLYQINLVCSDVMAWGTPAMQNVIDCDIYVPESTVSPDTTALKVNCPKGLFKIPMYGKDNTSRTFGATSVITGTIPATESQMQDTDWLIQQGFDVVPSNT